MMRDTTLYSVYVTAYVSTLAVHLEACYAV